MTQRSNSFSQFLFALNNYVKIHSRSVILSNTDTCCCEEMSQPTYGRSPWQVLEVLEGQFCNICNTEGTATMLSKPIWCVTQPNLRFRRAQSDATVHSTSTLYLICWHHMPQIGNFQAWIDVENEHLPEYAVEYSADGKQATCWIPSEAGKVCFETRGLFFFYH